MKTLIKTLLIVSVLWLSGCANWTTAPVYSQSQTPTSTQTNAQGSAADYAAMANVTFNCPSCTDAQKQQLMNYLLIKYQQDLQASQVLDKGARSDLADTVNWRLNRALDQALFEILQNY